MTVDGWIRVVRRNARLVAAVSAAGLAAGVTYALLTPPLFAATSQVVLPGAPVSTSGAVSRDVETNVRIAGSATVLRRAAEAVDLDIPTRELQSRVEVSAVTADILTVRAEGETADEARALADAVADAYVAYAWSTDAEAATAAARSPSATARVLEYAPDAVKSGTMTRLLAWGALGAVAAGVLCTLALLYARRDERRLHLRDEIADAVGLPVIASVQTSPPTDVSGWAQLLGDYTPAPADAWSLRNALRFVGPSDARPHSWVSVVSLAGDKRALAVGPQVAAFAASRGLPAALVIRTQHATAAALRTACSALVTGAGAGTGTGAGTDSRDVTVSLAPPAGGAVPGRGLTVAVDVADGDPPAPGGPANAATVVAVTAGFATAEDLARVAVAVADAGGDVAGIIVADPDPEDRTSGRVPSAARREPVPLISARTADTTRTGRR